MENVPTPVRLRIADQRDPAGGGDDLVLLRDLAARIHRSEQTMVGFPVNLDFDYRDLVDFLRLHINNAGSPRESSDYGLDTKPFERAVVDFFAQLAGGRPDELFGYITHGGTEGNIFAAYVGRERYPDAVLYASADAHYSVPKMARMLRIEHVPVDTDKNGSMDLDRLRQEFDRRSGRAALVIATIGTTGRGASDDLPGIRAAAAACGIERLFVHSDAAYGGPLAALGEPRRPWAFESGADSVTVSGHKFIGSPVPSSVVLARRGDVESIREPGAAVGSDDDTLSGSRDGLSPLFLWYSLRRLGRDGLAERVRRCLQVTDYAVERLSEAGQHPTRAPYGNVILFDLPSDEVLRRWHLLDHGGQAHMVVMPHVTTQLVDRLCAELR